jgi:hypothetical protein
MIKFLIFEVAPACTTLNMRPGQVFHGQIAADESPTSISQLNKGNARMGTTAEQLESQSGSCFYIYTLSSYSSYVLRTAYASALKMEAAGFPKRWQLPPDYTTSHS